MTGKKGFMFTEATKNFGVWKEHKKNTKISFVLLNSQFLFALSFAAFVVFLAFIIIVKVRQEFFLVESAPVYLFKNKEINSNFLLQERPSAISIFIKKASKNNLQIYFDKGESFLIPKETEEFLDYLLKRKKDLIYIAMIMRMNSDKNSRVKILTERTVTFEEVQLITKIFSQYGFDSFDVGIER